MVLDQRVCYRTVSEVPNLVHSNLDYNSGTLRHVPNRHHKAVIRGRKWDPYNPASERYRELIRREINPLIFYPLVFLLLNIFSSINRIQNAVAPKYPIFALFLLQAISDPILGLGCSIVFVINRDTLRELKWSNFKSTMLTRCKQRTKVTAYEATENKYFRYDEHPI